MSATYGGTQCLDPGQEAANCLEQGRPLLPWWGQCNSFVCPLGPEPGRGRVLLNYADCQKLNKPANPVWDLVFWDGQNPAVTLKSLLFVRAFPVTPAYNGDPEAAMWAEVADARYLCQAVPYSKRYNVRSSPGGAYFSATLNSGSPWTWAQMTQDLWQAVGKLGAWPGLPAGVSPDGVPEGMDFDGGYAYSALSVVLDKIGCALKYDPTTGKFSIVQLGAADAAEAKALAGRAPQELPRLDAVESVRGRLPAKVRVLFTKQQQAPDATGGSRYYALDVADPTAGGPLAGSDPATEAVLIDDLPAIYDLTGTLTNAAALSTRANSRAADYFRRSRPGRIDRSFTGSYGDPGLLPGSQLKATIWSDRGGGSVTEVQWSPGLMGQIYPGGEPGGLFNEQLFFNTWLFLLNYWQQNFWLINLTQLFQQLYVFIINVFNLPPNTVLPFTGNCANTLVAFRLPVLLDAGSPGGCNLFVNYLTLPTVSGNVADLDPTATGCSVHYRLVGSSAVDYTISGIKPATDPELAALGLPSPGPQVIVLFNASPNATRFRLKNNDGVNGTAGHLFNFPNGFDVYIPKNGSFALWYDTHDGVWRPWNEPSCGTTCSSYNGPSNLGFTYAVTFDPVACTVSASNQSIPVENGRIIDPVACT